LGEVVQTKSDPDALLEVLQGEISRNENEIEDSLREREELESNYYFLTGADFDDSIPTGQFYLADVDRTPDEAAAKAVVNSPTFTKIAQEISKIEEEIDTTMKRRRPKFSLKGEVEREEDDGVSTSLLGSLKFGELANTRKFDLRDAYAKIQVLGKTREIEIRNLKREMRQLYITMGKTHQRIDEKMALIDQLKDIREHAFEAFTKKEPATTSDLELVISKAKDLQRERIDFYKELEIHDLSHFQIQSLTGDILFLCRDGSVAKRCALTP
jgi:hypothetical protein